MKKFIIKTLLFILGLIGSLYFAYYAQAQSIPSQQPFWVSGGNITPIPLDVGLGFQVPSLANLNCIGTNSAGTFGAGTCSGGGGTASSTLYTDSGTWSGFNRFLNQTVFGGIFATNASSTNATTTNFAITGTASNCGGTSALTSNSSGVVGCTAQPQGTVTAVSVASSNGFAGSSSGGATPTLTLTTTVTSNVLKGTGTAITGAVNGTDYTLNTALTCGGGQFFNAETAAGIYTCGTPAGTTYTGTFPIIVTGSVLSSGYSTTTNTGLAQGIRYIGSGGIDQIAASSSIFGFTPQPAGNYATFGFPFTPTLNFGVNTNATSTPMSFFQGIFASTTSTIASTTFAINGNVGIGTSSPVTTLTVASKASADQTPALVIDGVTGGFNADMQLNRGSNTGTEEANIDFATASVVNWQVGIQNNNTSDFELWDGTNDPVFTVKSTTNAIGFGTSTPFGDFAIDADYGDALPGNLIFNVASSSLTATTSVFSVSNIGSTTLGLFGVCSGTQAVTTNAAGTLVCGTITGTGGVAYPFFASTFGILGVSATTTALYPSGLITGTSTIGSLVATSSLTNNGVKNALVVDGANGLEAAYAGASACGANNWVTTLSAIGGSTCGTIGANGLTLSMFPTIAANTVIGNLTANTATPTAFATSSLFTGSTGQVGWFSSVGALTGTSSITFTAPTTTIASDFLIQKTSTNALQINDNFGSIDAIFNTASSTGNQFQIEASTTPNANVNAPCGGSTVCLFTIDQYGHLTASSTRATPTLGTCTGGATFGANSNDVTGDITLTTAVTSCAVVFASVYAVTPEVILTGSGTVSFPAVTAVSTTGFTIGVGAAVTGDKISYLVIQP